MAFKPRTKTILYAALAILALWLILRATRDTSHKKEGLTTQELDAITRDCQNEMNRVYNQMSASMKSIENYSKRVQKRTAKANRGVNPTPNVIIDASRAPTPPANNPTPDPNGWFTL